jgi:hypothetical protein
MAIEWILTLGSAPEQASPMKDGRLGPKLVLGHLAPMTKRGLTAGAFTPTFLPPLLVSCLKEPPFGRGHR